MSLGLSKYKEIPGSQCEYFTLSLKNKTRTPRSKERRQTDREHPWNEVDFFRLARTRFLERDLESASR